MGQVFGRVAPHPKAPHLAPDPDGFLWVSEAAFRDAIVPDGTPEEIALLASTQKPIALRCLGEAMTPPAWKEIPSWFLIAETDRMVSPEPQRFTAEEMGAKVVSLPVDHTPLISAPDAVADVITEAARSAGAFVCT